MFYLGGVSESGVSGTSQKRENEINNLERWTNIDYQQQTIKDNQKTIAKSKTLGIIFPS